MGRDRKVRVKPRPRSEYDVELLRAVAAGEADWVEELLEAGADPNTRDDRGNPALYHVTPALSAGFVFRDVDARILAALLKAGADPKLDDVALRLGRAAWRAVSSAAEAGDARRLLHMLGLRSEELGSA
ncbi:MAG: hypothetical protein KC486_05945 [Myxococcales bacterium]|nr:hypothetical protein [Myxococcales bacterium]